MLLDLYDSVAVEPLANGLVLGKRVLRMDHFVEVP
jgi:hypothetical protein